jgi:hypothetical protein
VIDIRSTVAVERGALADDLAITLGHAVGITGRTVRDMVARLSATASLNPATFALGMARADRAATLAEFRGLQNSTSAAPGPR